MECSSTISEDHTGTVMLQAATPNSVTVTLDGGGSRRCSSGCCSHEAPEGRQCHTACSAGRGPAALQGRQHPGRDPDHARRDRYRRHGHHARLCDVHLGVGLASQRGDDGHHAPDRLGGGLRGHPKACRTRTFAIVFGASSVNGTCPVHSAAGPQLHRLHGPAEYWSSTTSSFSSSGDAARHIVPRGTGERERTAAAHGDGGLPRQRRNDHLVHHDGGGCPHRPVRWWYLPVRRLPAGLGPAADRPDRGIGTLPRSLVVVEDKTGCVVQNDASQVQLAITAGTGTPGATLNNCLANLSSGQTSFLNCAINALGTATG